MGRNSGRKKSGFKNKKQSPTGLPKVKHQLTQFLDSHYGEEFAEKQLIKKLALRDATAKKSLDEALQELVADGHISKSPRNLYSSAADPEFIVGEVDFVNARFAFIVPEDQEKKKTTYWSKRPTSRMPWMATRYA